jgi:uncharacterized protein (DUF2141 family)
LRKPAFISKFICHLQVKPSFELINMMETTMNMILKTSLFTAAFMAVGCAGTVVAPQSEAALPDAVSSSAGVITVKVDGLKVQGGQVSAALFDEAGYKGGAPLRGKNAEVSSGSVILKFEDMPAGEYGLKMYHDVDMDGQMNTNAFGLPTEPYAFSNNAVGMMGPAKWDAAKFTVSADGAVQDISFK